ncbi:MAG: response regulator [Chloroflexota bacterium]
MTPDNIAVLVVDDDPETVRIFEFVLQKEGYIAIIAGTVAEALERMHEVRPDVVLLDLMLPHANGVDLLKHIRTTAGYEDMQVIIISAHAIENQHLPTGVQPDAILRKPIRIPALSKAIRAAIA